MTLPQFDGADILAGTFFHTLENGRIQKQGVILGHVRNDFYLCELFEWITGFPNGRRLFRLAEIADCRLYDSSESMNAAYLDEVRA